MAARRRRAKRKAEITDEEAAWIRGDYGNAGFTNYIDEDAKGDLWLRYCDAVVEDYAQEYPGYRPGRWWAYNAPEMRKRVGGIGTPCHEVLEHFQKFRYGLPLYWITPWQVSFYSGPIPTSYGYHARPIASGAFTGVAIDTENPPSFESQAAFLRRHKLFLPSEAKRLSKDDFDPEVITRTE